MTQAAFWQIENWIQSAIYTSSKSGKWPFNITNDKSHDITGTCLGYVIHRKWIHCDCTRKPAHRQTHLRHIYFHKNVPSQLPRTELESLFTECSSRSVIQWAHPPTLHTADDKSDDVLLKYSSFLSFPQFEQNWYPQTCVCLLAYLESTSHIFV